MRCLCIGGMCAGSYQYVGDDVPHDFTIRIPYQPPLRVEDLLSKHQSDTCETHEQLYKLTLYRYDGACDFFLLRNADLEPDEAIERIKTVVHELTNLHLPADWHRWSPEEFRRAMHVYAEVGDPYAPN